MGSDENPHPLLSQWCLVTLVYTWEECEPEKGTALLERAEDG